MVKKIITGFLDLILLALVILIAYFSVRAAWTHYYKTAFPLGYTDIVLEQSRETGVPASLLFAVIRTESGFKPEAQSSVSARGLMQITEETFEWARYRLSDDKDLSFDDLFTSEVNIRYGAEILRLLLDEFGTENNALCAYHAGWGNAQRWLKNPDYSEGGHIGNIPFGDTRRYVAKVLETKRIYEKLYGL